MNKALRSKAGGGALSLPPLSNHVRAQPAWRSPLRRPQLAFAAVVLSLVLPWLALFWFAPIPWVFWLSLHRYSPGAGASPFVGLANYAAMVGDPAFWRSLGATLKFVAMVLPLNLAITLPLAIAIEGVIERRLKDYLRTAYFLPTITSMAAVALIWQYLYHPTRGPINAMLQTMGIPPVNWLGDARTALPAVVVTYVWQDMGYNLVIFIAGLAGIPRTFYEAAMIDGARKFAIFRYITLPLLQPTLVFVLVMTMLSAFKVFVPVQVMTKGGPFDSTRVLTLYIYQNAFEWLKMGYGAALAVVLLVIMLMLTLLYRGVLWRKWEY